MKKTIVLLLSLMCIFTSCNMKKAPDSMTVAYRLTEKQMEQRGYTKEISEYSGENVLAYKNADNTKTICVFSAPIETSLNEITPLEGRFYEGEGRVVFKKLPEKLSKEHPIRASGGTGSVEIMPAEDRECTSDLKEAENIFGQRKSAVVYQNLFGEGLDGKCMLTSFGINTEITLTSPPKTNKFRIKIKLNSLIPDTGSPDYILFKTALEKGEVRAILYTPLAADKNGNWCYENLINIVEKDSSTDTYTIEYTVSQNFLEDKATKYPVTLNQSIHLYRPKQPDTSAYQNTGEHAGHYLSPYMLLGDKTVKGEGWTYIRYETLEKLNIPAEKIVSAKYTFRNLFDLDKEVKIGAYAVTTDWCSINTRWFNRPTNDKAPLSQTIIRERGDYTLDITPLFKEMIANKGKTNAKYSVQNSFLIRSDTTDSNMIFASGDNGNFCPFLEIIIKE